MTARDIFELRFPHPLPRALVRVLLALLLLWSFGLRFWYALPTPDSTRFWDERYGLENLEPLLKHGQLRPVHGFHPGFSYLPHGLVLKASDIGYRLTGWEGLAIFDQRGRYTPTTYRICRTISVLFGTLSLLLVYLMGRRLGGDRLGLWAAFLLSLPPWHLRQSVLFKADIALLFTVTLTLWASLRAIERPGVRSFVGTGAAIGLALSSKFNAGPVALPLTAGAFLSRGTRGRALLLLGCAAAASVVVFLAIQPFALIDPDIYRRSMSQTSRVYEGFARREGSGRLYLPLHLLESLISGSFHGPWIGSLAVCGVLALIVFSLRYRQRSALSLPWVMMLTYLVGYTLLYAIATPRPSPHNWLPVTPVTSLAAAWALLALWLLAGSRIAAGLRAPVAAATAAGLVLFLGWQASEYVYRETVPRTGDRALELLRANLRRPPGRLVVSEHDFQIRFETRHRLARLAVDQVQDLRQMATASLDWSDAEVFAAERLEDPATGAFYRSRLERLKSKRVFAVEPAWFRAWGPPLVVLLHPLIEDDPVSGALVRRPGTNPHYVAQLPAGDFRHHRGSLDIRLRRRLDPAAATIDEQPLVLVDYRSPKGPNSFTSYRFPIAGQVELRLGQASGPARIPFVLRTWRLGRGRHLRKNLP